ncbi:hypothetical protein CYY_006696 [Polysphondylium violaceum]|uniref:Ras guanine nucleotide exchange factor glfB-like C-terminal domain-containing protein n=1 Tax=Polysphondylium violaceum TaxID=133409 RepID=A0A8J4UYT0_9MYCE|nr:hypothetical protein CYY_006696 [Polysphondylium violaceum]
MAQPYKLQKPKEEIPLETSIINVWNEKIDELPVYKDLPRLAGRITIESAKSLNEIKLLELENNPPSLRLSKDMQEIGKFKIDKLEEITPISSNSSADEKVWHNVQSVVCKLADIFETPDKAQIIKNAFNTSKPSSDYQLTLPSLFESCMDVENSKVVKILKLIHQNIIYIGTYELKTKVPFLMTYMTKDVRGAEGWRINVFSKDTVSVTHTKREESLATAPSDKQFWLEWQLHVTLNKELTEITHSSLKITDLQFKQGINPQFKEEIKRNLCSGNLYVS